MAAITCSDPPPMSPENQTAMSLIFLKGNLETLKSIFVLKETKYLKKDPTEFREDVIRMLDNCLEEVKTIKKLTE